MKKSKVYWKIALASFAPLFITGVSAMALIVFLFLKVAYAALVDPTTPITAKLGVLFGVIVMVGIVVGYWAMTCAERAELDECKAERDA